MPPKSEKNYDFFKEKFLLVEKSWPSAILRVPFEVSKLRNKEYKLDFSPIFIGWSVSIDERSYILINVFADKFI